MKKYIRNPKTNLMVDADGKVGSIIIKEKKRRNQTIQYYLDREGKFLFTTNLQKRMIPVSELVYCSKTKKEIIQTIVTQPLSSVTYWRRFINQKYDEGKCCIVEKPGDGDCLFHSLSSYISGFNGNTLRKHIVKYEKQFKQVQIAQVMLADPEECPEYMDYLNQNEIDFDKLTRRQKFQGYLKVMNRKGVYGSEMEISCFVDLFELNVIILNKDNTINIISPSTTQTDKNIFLFYDDEHYDVLFLDSK